jgi:hypothetical protein
MTQTYKLLEYADDADQELYFDPPVEVEVMAPVPEGDDQEREYQLLSETSYTLNSALGEAAADEPGPLAPAEFNIPDQTVKDYLELMQDGKVDDQIHNHRAMGREEIVSLTKAGYQQPSDFISESIDYIDIAKDAGVNREVVSAVAQQFIGGFSTGTELRDEAGPFAQVPLSDSFTGWSLRDCSPSDTVVRWVTEGRFNLTVKVADDRYSVVVNTPEDEKHDYYRKGREVILDAEDTTAKEAVKLAHDWLSSHQIPAPGDNSLVATTQIGPATRDYLALEFGIESEDDLADYIESHPDEAEDVFHPKTLKKYS